MTKSFFAFALGFAAAALASTAASAQDRPPASGSTGGAAVQGPGSPQGGTLQGAPSRGGPAPAGLNREQMWFAPTAEDWKKPCLITWQRTWEDAHAVSKATGKPLLVCVNMDGEIASEHYAGVRYRQPEIAKLYEPYVCVIASVYRHNPRDWDEQGRRLLCPRFGSVTCGEHIAIEPKLYGQFFDGQRVAPRHIGVEQDGKEMYDVFYAWDTDTIFNSLKKGVENR
ncbi:MAG: thioredoxin family protein, partial [Planctomycetes bacterium]|nr:thioredoxin family protein [Planctomycetota bacterium]